MTVDDLGGEEYSSDFTLSPDSKMVAFVKHTEVGMNEVWVEELGSQALTRIIGGEDTKVQFLAIKWSTKGSRLAMLTTTDDSGMLHAQGLHLLVWDKNRGRTWRPTEQWIYDTGNSKHPFEWISEDRLICGLLPEGKGLTPERTAMGVWNARRAGQEPTVSVLDSGIPQPVGPHAEFAIVDVDRGVIEKYQAGVTVSYFISSDRKYVAALERIQSEPCRFDRCFPASIVARMQQFDLLVISVGIDAKLSKKLEFGFESTKSGESLSIEWSQASRYLAINSDLLGDQRNSEGETRAPFNWFRCDIESGDCTRFRTGQFALRADSLMMLDRGSALVYGVEQGHGSTQKLTRRDWWVVESKKSPERLTSGWDEVPPDGALDPSAQWLFLIKNGSISRMSTNFGRTETIKLPNSGKAARFLGPRTQGPFQVVSGEEGDQQRTFLLDTTSGTTSMIKPPPNTEEVEGLSLAGQVWIFSTQGSMKELCGKNLSGCIELSSGFANQISEPERRPIKYRSLDGEELRGQITLPIPFIRGKKYPLIVCEYPGSDGECTFFDLRLLSAHGFAVLLPDMPMPPGDGPIDVYRYLLNGVIPAVDKAIEMGIADPDRLGVMGHSFGGYGVMGIITQTTRFRAAVAMAGISDFISFYGGGGFQGRYSNSSQYAVGAGAGISQDRLGSPPWDDLGRYIRNSPLFYVERVETPVLIVHGDQDGSVPIEQSEEFFMALRCENKRAQFLRYWGEGHTIDGLANKKDLARRVLAWFDEFLKPRETPLPKA